MLKSIIKGLVYTGPIAVVFCYVFKDTIKQLFQKMSLRQHRTCLIAALFLVVGVCVAMEPNHAISISGHSF
ncbi:hypothetical protein EXW39_29790 (plasmid) [Bacillus mycoides]|uniref:hypothetical protein n=1 Tax=Bacillus mycoides TaxID=1405 RepID=UPI001C00AD0B|nr:hypothetical protein [Bacillus mycoides]QWH64239.1 hypothetical protein EXW39_29790 [Bacillus mycoides]